MPMQFSRFLSLVGYKLLARFFRARSYPKKVRKILIIRRNRLGDAVNVTPILRWLKHTHPEIELHVLANQYNAAVFKYCPFVDDLHVREEFSLLKNIFSYRGDSLTKLRKLKFDLVVGLGGYSSKLALLVGLVRGKYNIGNCSNTGSVWNLIYDSRELKQQPRGANHVKDMFAIFSATHFLVPNEPPYTYLDRPEIPVKGRIALCPDVKRLESRYPVESYKRVIELLIKEGAAREFYLFAERESPYASLEHDSVKRVHTSTVETFIKELSKCCAAISAEGGSAHLAGALGLGVVVISGMGHQSYWKPHSARVCVLDRANAVDSITPEEVVNCTKLVT